MNDAYEIRDKLVGERNLYSISELYHENSKLIPCAPRIRQSVESLSVAPEGFKNYQYAQRISLRNEDDEQIESTLSVITNRRSCRQYASICLSIEAISVLLKYSFGMIDGQYHRYTPSAGGLYPLELYMLATNVSGIDPGLYHYDVRHHCLCVLEKGDFREQLEDAIFIKEAAQTASATIVLTGVFGRTKIKYGERGYRFVLIEAGHAMQNICIAATAMGLGTCPIGGFVDDHLNLLFDLDGVDEAALYAVTVGVPN
jgi:SagB-type dehydrogenase family enzyme